MSVSAKILYTHVENCIDEYNDEYICNFCVDSSISGEIIIFFGEKKEISFPFYVDLDIENLSEINLSGKTIKWCNLINFIETLEYANYINKHDDEIYFIIDDDEFYFKYLNGELILYLSKFDSTSFHVDYIIEDVVNFSKTFMLTINSIIEWSNIRYALYNA